MTHAPRQSGEARSAKTACGLGPKDEHAVTRASAAGAQPLEIKEQHSCTDCGKGITGKSRSGKCFKCANVNSHAAARRPMPEDFAEVAKGMSKGPLMKHYKAGHKAVLRWLQMAGLPLPKCRADAKPIPPDFAAVAPTMTRNQLAQHYRVHMQAVRRWLRLTNVEPAAFRPAKRAIVLKPPKAKPVHWITYGAPHAPKVDASRDTSLEGLAAEHLRCATRAPVYRCTERGCADPQGGFWRYGNVVLSPANLFERAYRFGFEARRFAA